LWCAGVPCVQNSILQFAVELGRYTAVRAGAYWIRYSIESSRHAWKSGEIQPNLQPSRVPRGGGAILYALSISWILRLRLRVMTMHAAPHARLDRTDTAWHRDRALRQPRAEPAPRASPPLASDAPPDIARRRRRRDGGHTHVLAHAGHLATPRNIKLSTTSCALCPQSIRLAHAVMELLLPDDR
jgi:hypothetical protein